MKKIKIYLDTNTIIDFFINQSKAMRKKEDFKMPKKLEFFIDNLDKLEFVTSILTQAEIIRELAAGYGLTNEQINYLWKEFLELLECDYIETVTIDKRFAEAPLRIRMKLRTLVNFQHLFVAMDNTVYLLSGDKDLIKVVREHKIYDKIISYIELRELISSFSQDL